MTNDSRSDNSGWFALLFEQAPAAILVADDDGRYIDANLAALELFGVSRDDLIGKTVADFAAPGYDFTATWAKFIREGHLAGGFPLLRPDGQVRFLSYSAKTNIFPGVHISVIFDVTNENRIETRLRESESQLGQLVYANPAGMLVWSTETGGVLMVNEAFLSVTGRWRSEVIGKGITDTGIWADPQLPLNIASTLDRETALGSIDAPFVTRSGKRRNGIAAFSLVTFEESPAVLCVLLPAAGD